jgi:hypothetical protein
MKNKITISTDEIREHILDFLHSTRKKARSLKSISASITEIKSGLKPLGISQNDVVTNLDFLVQNKWVIEEEENKPFKTPKGFTVDNKKLTYKLSDLGIKHFEDESKFNRTGRYDGINITNINGVTVVGNNNIVRNEFKDVFQLLDRLEQKAKITSEIPEEKKIEVTADISTIKVQLSKPIPNTEIVWKAMDALAFIASIPGLVEIYNLVKESLSKILI